MVWIKKKRRMTENTEKEDWDLIIRPRSSFFDLHLREVWNYKDLIGLFIKRDFAAQYKQTILGPVWHVIQPILTTAIFLLLFGKIANIPTDGIQPILFYMSGITLWNYFSACLTSTANTFVVNAPIFGKVYFPRLVIPLSVVFSNIIRLGIQFSLLLAVMIWYHFKGFPITIGMNWLLIPVLILLIAGISLGLGIIVSSLTTKYRDFAILMTFIIQLLMYVTPIGYPMSFLSHSKYKRIIELNPLTGIVESFRYALFGKGSLDLTGLIYSFTFMLVSLILGLLIFTKVERSFMDTV
jgi:lipopolysaccharide transport system permease protein